MKYYKYYLTEISGEYEFDSQHVIALEDGTDLEKESHRIARENRGAEVEDYDPKMEGYWCDGMITKLPGFEPITEEQYKAVRSL